jgi:class 3 adenylate cyclase
MSAEAVKRKLNADVQGYSRLMGDDEHATVETITAYRKIMTDLIKGLHGRVVDAIEARMQCLAEPGGICISGSDYEQIKNKISIAVV